MKMTLWLRGLMLFGLGILDAGVAGAGQCSVGPETSVALEGLEVVQCALTCDPDAKGVVKNATVQVEGVNVGVTLSCAGGGLSCGSPLGCQARGDLATAATGSVACTCRAAHYFFTPGIISRATCGC